MTLALAAGAQHIRAASLSCQVPDLDANVAEMALAALAMLFTTQVVRLPPACLPACLPPWVLARLQPTGLLSSR
jgi:hypothetical protein